jgi:hypothetical protein
MVVIRGTRRSGHYEMVGTMESAIIVVPIGNSTSKAVGVDDMLGWSCNG